MDKMIDIDFGPGIRLLKLAIRLRDADAQPGCIQCSAVAGDEAP